MEIDTNSMELADYGHGIEVRCWRGTETSLNDVARVLGFRSGSHWCEHVLELD